MFAHQSIDEGKLLSDWRDSAACRAFGVDPEWFFPISEQDTETIERATAICAQCPVQAECLAWAMRPEAPERAGIWGGLTEWQRWTYATRREYREQRLRRA